KINSLPQTIVGRCQKIHFEPLTPKQISSKLEETTSYSKKDIELASRISSGSYNRALQLLEMGIKELRDSVLEFLVSVLKNEYADSVLIARNITAKNDRDKTRFFLYLLSTWFRDLLQIKYHSENYESNAANSDVIERLKKLDANYPDTDIYGIIMEIEEADKLISQNVQLALILVNLSFRLKELIK